MKLAKIDPRYTIAFLLFSYLFLGFTVLGFNRSPSQVVLTSLSACLLEILLAFIFKKRKLFFPLSALITSFSLSILLNYSHDHFLLLVPVFFAIGSKYILVFNDKHLLNPAQAAVSFTLIFAGSLITSAPAYQWNGIASMGVFVAGLGIFFLVPQVKRFPLVISFLFFFSLQTLFRAWLMKHHLPFETLFLGTITSPAFFLFTFFMITDPMTSPSNPRTQVLIGFLLALFDLAFHLKQSYYTFFYAGLTVQLSRLALLHFSAIKKEKNISIYLKDRFWNSGYYKRPLALSIVGLCGVLIYTNIISPKLKIENLNFTFEEISAEHSGIKAELGDVLLRVDPRIQHLIKWILSVGDSVATGDFDNDGLVDIFATNVLKDDKSRNALYRNMGDFKFERFPIEVIEVRSKEVEKYGLCSNALFADYDNDGDLDLYLSYAFGNPVLLKNNLMETGKVDFVDVTADVGLDIYVNSLPATFFDMNNDGLLDLMIGNVWPSFLPDYPTEKPEKLNLFNLPKEEYEGDIRMYNFMHASWHQADNGGVNLIFLQNSDGKFTQLNSNEIGIPEHYWSLAIAAADLNQDGWTDIYVANDFGPDNLYFNQEGKSFKKIEGRMFGEVGKDTYKGMNASIMDVDNNGYYDIYVSNVHHEMQAEGSLLWMLNFNEKKKELEIIDRATQLGALNENRFGWGAAIVDFNNDGLLDIAQANGMVDDSIDKKFDTCPDYWYVNEKIARSAPSYHRHVNYWGDIRGYCIYGKEKNRLYLNTGYSDTRMFSDVADQVGMAKADTSSRGMAAADFNNDGLLDLAVSHQFRPISIFKNKFIGAEVENNWIGLTLESLNKSCNRMALGSKIELSYFDNSGKKNIRVRETNNVNGFSAQNESRVHFGLGNFDKSKPIEVNISWCGKVKKLYSNLEFNRYQKVTLD